MAVIGWITDTDFHAQLQQLLSDTTEALSAGEIVIADAKLLESYNIIKSVLFGRGATQADLDAWLRKVEFQGDIATFLYVIVTGKHRANEETSWWKPFDRRKDLLTVSIVKTDGTLVKLTEDIVADVLDLKAINENLGI